MTSVIFTRGAPLCPAFLALAALALPAAAQNPAARACPGNDAALGVTRVIEIDASTGPQFGYQQYKQNDFLKHKEVVLTFDDGPVHTYTKPVLQALSAHCTKATFFMVGRMAMNNPGLVREIAAKGHTVATHTWTHKNLGNRSKEGGIRQIERGISAVSKALGRPAAPFFRFPYLADPRRMINYLKGRGIAIFSIDVDSKDYQTRSGATVERRVLRDLKAQGKGILLFHDIQRSTARAMPSLLQELKARGYKIVHLVAKAPVTTLSSFDAEADALFKAHDESAYGAGSSIDRRTAQTRPRRAQRSRRRRRKPRSDIAKQQTAPQPRPVWQEQIFGGG